MWHSVTAASVGQDMGKLIAGNLLLLCLGLLGTHGLREGPYFRGVDPSVFEGPMTRADTYVTIKNGTLLGKTGTTLGGMTMYTYQSIPYAAAPVGDLRFRAPQPFEQAWGDNVRDATKFPPSCTQFEPAIQASSEDCLFVNVYTTATPEETTAKLPVMVFIHGGSFASGESTYYSGGKLLIKPGVVVVVQYRLGPLGFLSTADAEAPGNAGLKDMVQALRWIQENIEAFGGDPDNVTVLGESAGGASALYMLLSPLAKGLVHRVIGQSGSPIAAWALERSPLRSAQIIATHFGCPTGTSAQIVSCLRQQPWEDLVQYADQYGGDAYAQLELGLEFSTPTIEPELPGAFLTKEPMEIMRNGELNDVPVMLGTTLHEGSYVLGLLYQAYLGPNNKTEDVAWMRDDLIPSLLGAFGISERQGPGAISESVALAFMPGSTRENFTEIMPNIVDMMSVFFMKAAALRTADILSRRLTSPVYLYSLEQFSKNSMWTWLFLGEQAPPISPGITHADDLMYLFNMPVIPGPNDTAFSRIISTMWNDFARTGNPTPEPSETYPTWPAYDTRNQQFMRLNMTASVASDFVSSWLPRGFEPY